MVTKLAHLPHPARPHAIEWGRIAHQIAWLAWPVGVIFVLTLFWWGLSRFVHGLEAFSGEAYVNGLSAVTGAVLIPGFIPIAMILALPLLVGIVVVGLAIAFWTTREMWTTPKLD